MDYLATIPVVYIEKVSDFLFKLMKNGSENKSVAFIFLFSVLYYYMNLYDYTIYYIINILLLLY